MADDSEQVARTLQAIEARLLENHDEIRRSLDDVHEHLNAQSEGIMRLIDRLGPADPLDPGD